MTTVKQISGVTTDDSSVDPLVDQQVRQQREKEDKVIARAKRLLLQRMQIAGKLLSSVREVQDFLVLQLSERHNEVFCCLFLDNQHRLIEYHEIFFGTIDGCSVHPREVVRMALKFNAAAVIFAHNHPSGVAEPSQSDMRITERLSAALELIDVRVIDHFIVGRNCVVSFAQQGLLV